MPLKFEKVFFLADQHKTGMCESNLVKNNKC